ncbi:hypothetical protein PV04_09301 [Phialophora macrospora]|uniref:Uncharacterized protein n=1 Tax=Phialophora macrospora TaxID=1851006 RepID=A0A0D2FWL5_9EURO|nr:hypothetical protein PV04_09301 [Phialophora macrospora]
MNFLRTMRDDFRLDLDRIRADIARNADTLNELVGALNQSLRTIGSSISNADGTPIGLHRRLDTVDERLNALSAASTNVHTKLDGINRTLTAPSDTDTIAGRLATVKSSLTAANGTPIILHERLDPIMQAVTNRNDHAAMVERLDLVKRSLTAANGLPIILHDQLETIGRVLRDDVATRLATVKQSLTTVEGHPIVLDQSLQNIDRDLATVRDDLRNNDGGLIPRVDGISRTLTNLGDPQTMAETLGIIRQSLTDTNGDPIIFHEQLGTIGRELNNTVTAGFETVGQSLTDEHGDPISLHQNYLQLQKELRAGHFNSAARAANARAKCANTPISAFRDTNYQRIPNFPPTYSHLKRLNEGVLDVILQRLGLESDGPLLSKQKLLKKYLGLILVSS